MKLTLLYYVCLQMVSADLIAWNRYKNMITKHTRMSRGKNTISYQDLIIRELIKHKNYVELGAFLDHLKTQQTRFIRDQLEETSYEKKK